MVTENKLPIGECGLKETLFCAILNPHKVSPNTSTLPASLSVGYSSENQPVTMVTKFDWHSRGTRF